MAIIFSENLYKPKRKFTRVHNDDELDEVIEEDGIEDVDDDIPIDEVEGVIPSNGSDFTSIPRIARRRCRDVRVCRRGVLKGRHHLHRWTIMVSGAPRSALPIPTARNTNTDRHD